MSINPIYSSSCPDLGCSIAYNPRHECIGKDHYLRYFLPVTETQDCALPVLNELGCQVSCYLPRPIYEEKIPPRPVCPVRLRHCPDFPEKFNTDLMRQIPEELQEDPFFQEHTDPISLAPIRFPLYDRHHPAHIYEQATITTWLREYSPRSPLTRELLTTDPLQPNSLQWHGESLREICHRLMEYAKRKFAEEFAEHKRELLESYQKHKDVAAAYAGEYCANEIYEEEPLEQILRPAYHEELLRYSEQMKYQRIRGYITNREDPMVRANQNAIRSQLSVLGIPIPQPEDR